MILTLEGQTTRLLFGIACASLCRGLREWVTLTRRPEPLPRLSPAGS